MVVRAYRDDLYGVRGVVPEFRRQPALPRAGTDSKVETAELIDDTPPGTTSDRRHWLQVAAAGLSIHDVRADCGIGSGAGEVWRDLVLRSEGNFVAHDVGRLHGSALHALE